MNGKAVKSICVLNLNKPVDTLDPIYRKYFTQSPELVFIGNYLFDISDGTIKLKLEQVGTNLIWANDGKSILYNNTPVDLEGNVTLSITTCPCIYNLSTDEELCIEEVREYFVSDPYGMENELFYTYSWSPNMKFLGFNYFGASNDHSTIGGGYCLYNLSDKSFDCIDKGALKSCWGIGKKKSQLLR